MQTRHALMLKDFGLSGELDHLKRRRRGPGNAFGDAGRICSVGAAWAGTGARGVRGWALLVISRFGVWRNVLRMKRNGGLVAMVVTVGAAMGWFLTGGGGGPEGASGGAEIWMRLEPGKF